LNSRQPISSLVLFIDWYSIPRNLLKEEIGLNYISRLKSTKGTGSKLV
jgi:hypothetical protein